MVREPGSKKVMGRITSMVKPGDNVSTKSPDPLNLAKPFIYVLTVRLGLKPKT